MTALHSLAYRSEASRPLTEADLGAILYASRLRNAELGVTGLLVFERSVGARGRFVQWIEGPGPAVASVFEERIVPASQHTALEVFHRGPVEARVFPDWSMSYARTVATTPLAALASLPRMSS